MACCRLSEVSPEELEELQVQVDSECNVQGGLGPAKVQDTLGYQMLLFPVSLYKASCDATDATVILSLSPSRIPFNTDISHETHWYA